MQTHHAFFLRLVIMSTFQIGLYLFLHYVEQWPATESIIIATGTAILLGVSLVAVAQKLVARKR